MIYFDYVRAFYILVQRALGVRFRREGNESMLLHARGYDEILELDLIEG